MNPPRRDTQALLPIPLPDPTSDDAARPRRTCVSPNALSRPYPA